MLRKNGKKVALERRATKAKKNGTTAFGNECRTSDFLSLQLLPKMLIFIRNFEDMFGDRIVF